MSESTKEELRKKLEEHKKELENNKLKLFQKPVEEKKEEQPTWLPEENSPPKQWMLNKDLIDEELKTNTNSTIIKEEPKIISPLNESMFLAEDAQREAEQLKKELEKNKKPKRKKKTKKETEYTSSYSSTETSISRSGFFQLFSGLISIGVVLSVGVLVVNQIQEALPSNSQSSMNVSSHIQSISIFNPTMLIILVSGVFILPIIIRAFSDNRYY